MTSPNPSGAGPSGASSRTSDPSPTSHAARRFRPEHGWWRAIWRTALAVVAAALLAISTAQAHARTSRPGEAPQPRAQARGAAPHTPSTPDSDQSPAPAPNQPAAADPNQPAAADPDQPAAANPDQSGDQAARDPNQPATPPRGQSPDGQNQPASPSGGQPTGDADQPGAPPAGQPPRDQSPSAGTAPAIDDCGSDPDCIQTDEDVDVCDADEQACDVTEADQQDK